MLTYIWIQTWSMRQALRFAFNGYDYGVIAKMFIMATKEVRYKRKYRH